MKTSQAVLPTATKPTTAATMARILSSGLSDAGLAAVIGAAARCWVGGWRWATGADVAERGAAATGAAAECVVGAGASGTLPAPVGPPGGSVGNLIVGAAEGLGGKLMRTVSFLGWTLPVSFFGGTAPAGTFGIFSAINLGFKIGVAPGLSNSYSKEKSAARLPHFIIAATTTSAAVRKPGSADNPSPRFS